MSLSRSTRARSAADSRISSKRVLALDLADRRARRLHPRALEGELAAVDDRLVAEVDAVKPRAS